MKADKRTRRSRTTRSVARGCVQRVVLRLRRARKALRLALLIIENDARASEHYAPESCKARLRWTDELRVESGCDKPQNKKAEPLPPDSERGRH